MSHPRIEEVEDSDLEAGSDPSEGDIDDFTEGDIMRRVDDRASAATATGPGTGGSLPLRPQQGQAAGAAAGGAAHEYRTTADMSPFAGFQCLYPVYFDAGRTRAEGRRVGRALAVANPLAREIVNACAALQLQTLFEPTKTHPKDWANPGRVKVDLSSSSSSSNIKNKHHLYILVAQHLARNPTAEHCASLRVRVPGAPLPDPAKPYPKPAAPRGWKMGRLVPYYSPAITGGGVSENLFKDMMKEMQAGGGGGGGGPGGMPDMASLLAGAGGPGGPGGGGNGGGGPGALTAAADAQRKKDKKGKGKG